MFGSFAEASASQAFAGQRWECGVEHLCNDVIANEAALALVYNSVPFVVMMATPSDVEDFVMGFSLSERIIHAPNELLGIRKTSRRDGIEINAEIAATRFAELDRKQRNLTGRLGCGLCGAQTLAQALRRPQSVQSTFRIAPTSLQRGLIELASRQPLNAMTGSMHAAAWLDINGNIRHAREDVGRHNALDKLIGGMIVARSEFSQGALLITSRASYEMVQKAATVGIQLVCAISAPTALAIRVAQELGVTLVAFARNGRHTAYTHIQRLTPAMHTVAA